MNQVWFDDKLVDLD